jgi:hypothetical protein
LGFKITFPNNLIFHQSLKIDKTMLKTAIATLFLGLFPLATAASASVIQTTGLVDIPSGTPVSGTTATLNRMNGGAEFNIDTVDLNEGAYTVWWVIFNNPEFCLDGCGEDDFGNLDVDASAFYADGGVIDSSGIGNFSGQILNGQLPGPEQVLFGNGLTDAFGAEIWNIVRYHGPVNSDPEIADLQTTTFNGGCTETPGDGLFECFDQQVAVFEQVSVPEPSVTFAIITLGILGISRITKEKQ